MSAQVIQLRPDKTPANKILRLTSNQRLAVAMLVRGRAYNDVAAELGINTKTLERWRKQAAFTREWTKQREEYQAHKRAENPIPSADPNADIDDVISILANLD